MRVLFLCDSLIGGGAEKLLNDLLPFFVIDKIQVRVLVLSLENEKYLKELNDNGIVVDEIPAKSKNAIKKIGYIKKYIKRYNPDIVHANLFPIIYYCSIAKKISRKFPVLVMTEHNTDNRRRHYKIFRPLEKWIYSSYDTVISISKKTEENLKDWLKSKHITRFITINNGIPIKNLGLIMPLARKEIEESIRDEDVLISMVGSLTTQKNHITALDTIRLLPDRYKLVIMGEGPLEKEIVRYINEKKLKNRVILLGFRKDVIRIVKACDIVFIPSIWEGFGLVAVEGMTCGKPIVASNVPGLAEVVGRAGILSEVNPYGFARAILKLADNNVYNEMQRKSVERAELFDIERMYLAYKKLYKFLISDKIMR